MRRSRHALGALCAAVLLAATGLILAPPASAAALTEVTNFGTNPGNLRMHLYVPDRVAARPAIVVAVHYCTGSGPAFHSGTQFASLADRYGFIVIYPSATRSGQCFDVYSPEALRRDGGSDPVSIMSMVRYAQQRHNGDPGRVYATGVSSGAMMTNVLLGDYPDVFKAGAAFAGVPFGCFATTGGSTWNSECANGQVIKTAQEWGNLVRNAYPGYSGPRPRMQLWHGTADETLRYPNFGEEIKQWTNVHGLSQTPAFTDSPQSGWTRTRYGSTGATAPVEAISMQGVSHNLPVSAAEAIRFFGLDTAAPPTAPPTTRPPTPPPSGGCAVSYTVNGWNTGFTGNVRIVNNSSAPINGWTLAFGFTAGQTVTSAWNGTVTQAGSQVTARNVAYNATIAGNGGSQSFGFQGTHTGSNPPPNSFSLNGSPCTVA
ncbi:PHB depolymerase family esterase [Micromonospora sp. NPDC049679]|uniref:extracellular catalytic domain type 1 short-chain-length polyhydroxyalkanoate depolymerase n=1 Tax=Micromonospora sp. NPDC049679 TaxID=3155920 RepID=UPI0033E4882D